MAASTEGGVLRYVARLGGHQIAEVTVGLHTRQVLGFALDVDEPPP